MQAKLMKTAQTWAFAVVVATGTLLAGCTEKDLYDPDYGKTKLPAPETLPDFNTRATVALDVDYEAPGFKTIVEVYTEYPYEQNADGDVVRKDILPVFAAYTDDNAKLNTSFELPAAVKQIFLHCPSMGMPQCITLDVVDNKISFKTSDLYAGASGAKARASSPGTSGKAPWMIDNSRKLYTLCQWGTYGRPTAEGYLMDGSNNSTMIGAIQSMLWDGKTTKPGGLDNSEYTKPSEKTNISIARWTMKDGVETKIESARLQLTFLQEAAWNQNVLGYYYYPTESIPKKAADVKKFILIPNVSTSGTPPFGQSNGSVRYNAGDAPLSKNQQVKLYYEKEDGTLTEDFPPGYTIGWFIISDAYNSNKAEVNTTGTYLYSNEAWNSDKRIRCIALNYQNEKVVLGFEDGNSDRSYEDMLFYIDSDPKEAIITPDQPEIPEPDPDYGDVTSETKGTLAFEDIWPTGGDYDMNDVVVEYSRKVTVNRDNKVKRIVDTFKAVQEVKSAAFNNAFAYQVDPTQVGTRTSLPEGASFEGATNSFIVFANAKDARGKEFVVTREFGDLSIPLDQLKSYNPFIIVKYVAGSTSRTEVHLPKRSATLYADKTLNGSADEAYYINKNGKFPFAIDLPIWGFTLVTEEKSIGSADEYPKFNSWVESGCGKTDANWYLNKK